VILSNELPDAFSVHKIILAADGAADVAFVVPAVPEQTWRTVRSLLPAAVAEAIEADDIAIEDRFLQGRREGQVYLTRSSFVAFLEHLLPTASTSRPSRRCSSARFTSRLPWCRKWRVTSAATHGCMRACWPGTRAEWSAT
jgi:hypothetical protein